ncbi:hypothetical protein B0H14DRAFT_2630470 [Mycena olivaceomarginata]|nr:hypothetical protein B0H14DRAFT_2630470 [Mycena olivaceomarginata]
MPQRNQRCQEATQDFGFIGLFQWMTFHNAPWISRSAGVSEPGCRDRYRHGHGVGKEPEPERARVMREAQCSLSAAHAEDQDGGVCAIVPLACLRKAANMRAEAGERVQMERIGSSRVGEACAAGDPRHILLDVRKTNGAGGWPPKKEDRNDCCTGTSGAVGEGRGGGTESDCCTSYVKARRTRREVDAYPEEWRGRKRAMVTHVCRQCPQPRVGRQGMSHWRSVSLSRIRMSGTERADTDELRSRWMFWLWPRAKKAMAFWLGFGFLWLWLELALAWPRIHQG